jgi:hypothetical protein
MNSCRVNVPSKTVPTYHETVAAVSAIATAAESVTLWKTQDIELTSDGTF